jgi:hypothetical protein
MCIDSIIWGFFVIALNKRIYPTLFIIFVALKVILATLFFHRNIYIIKNAM